MNSLGNLSFNFGKAKINISSIDLENMTAHIVVEIPIQGAELTFNVQSRIDWDNRRRVTFEVKAHQSRLPEPEEDESKDRLQDYNEEDSHA